jgi:hypothetical protein
MRHYRMNESEERVKRDLRISELMGKSIPELQKVLEEETKRQLARLIVDLEVNVKNLVLNNLVTIVGAALGFDLSWGRWEVKNHNESPITRAIGDLALANIKLVMPDFIEHLHADAKIQAAMKGAISQDYSYRLQRKITESIDAWVVDEAKKQSDTIIAALKLPGKK